MSAQVPAPEAGLGRKFASVGGATLVSRVLGFIRDVLLAAVLGTGPVADAFFAAFRFPNLFRRLFAEGAFNAAFVPLFARALEEKGREDAHRFAGLIVTWLFWFLLVVTILAEIFMAEIIALFVPGFVGDPERFDLTVLLARICFPYLACMSLMAAYGAILNGLRRYLAAAFAPVLLNIVLIAALAGLIVYENQTQADVGIILAAGVLVGGIVQLLLVGWAARRAGMLPGIGLPRLSPDVKRFGLLAGPAILTGGITQINIFVGTIIASGAASAISYLYYADRLYQLPLGMIGVAIGVVLLPELSRHLKGGRLAEGARAQDLSLLFALVFTLPAAAALFAIPGPVISVLFERGAFDAEARAATAAALAAFALGLPAFVLAKVFQPSFFAREDTATPTWFALVSAITNIVLSIALFPGLAHVGIAIATSVAGWVNALLLAIVLVRRGHWRPDRTQLGRYGVILVASSVMAGGAWGLSQLLAPWLSPAAPDLFRFASLAVVALAGAALYFALLHLSGALRLSQLRAAFRKPA